MTPPITRLRHERAQAIASVPAILDACDRENRSTLTKAEDDEVREAEARIADLDQRIEDRSRIARLAHSGAPIAAELTRGNSGTTRGARGFLSHEARALAEGTGPTGGYLVPAEYRGTIWDRLAAASVGLAAGFTVIETERDALHIPTVVSDAAASWTAEMEPIAPSDPTFGDVVATPRKLAALVQASNEVLNDSNPDVLAVVEQNLVRSMALKLDLGLFEGSGVAPEITGLRNVPGIQTVELGANGGPLTNLDPILDALGLLAAANTEASAIIMHPRTWSSIAHIREATGSNKSLLATDGVAEGFKRTLAGIPVYLSSQLSTSETKGTAANASSVYVVAAGEVVVVRRQDVEVVVDRSRLFDRDMSEVRAIARFDLVVPNPAAIVRIEGVTP